jgi:hypothetical protein
MAARPDRLTEREIRAVALATLAETMVPGQLLVEELGVEHGGARVDLARIGAGLEGFELKSDFDTLDRLAHQMHAYHGVFDTLTLVSTDTFLVQAEKLLPAWWGLWRVARTSTCTLALEVVRKASVNPRQDPRSVVALLWRDEAALLLEKLSGTRMPANASRARLYDVLVDGTAADTLRREVVAALLERVSLRGRNRLPVRSAARADELSARDGDWWRLAARS